MKKQTVRPVGVRRFGGWILSTSGLLECLKQGTAARFEQVTVGARQLYRLVQLLGSGYVLVKLSSDPEKQLVLTTMELTYHRRGGVLKASFGRPKGSTHTLNLNDGAWLKGKETDKPTIIRPRLAVTKGGSVHA